MPLNTTVGQQRDVDIELTQLLLVVKAAEVLGWGKHPIASARGFGLRFAA